MSESTARVTAVVSAFRPHFEYLAIAIESALAQTIPCDVLVTDSAHTDSIRDFALRYGPRVSYISNTPMVGVAPNHRNAIATIRTPYFGILNYDDAWEPTFAETLVGALDAHPECILAFSDHWVMDGEDRLEKALTDQMTAQWGRGALREGIQTDRAALLAQGTVPVAMSTIIRTAEAQQHPIPDASGPAYDLWLHYALAGEGRPYWYSPQRLTRWRVHPFSGTIIGNPEWYFGTAFCWDAVRADPRFTSIHARARHMAARAWWSAAKALLLRGAPREEVARAATHSLDAEPSLKAHLALRAPALLKALFSARAKLRLQ